MFNFVDEIYGFRNSGDPKAAFEKALQSLSSKSARAKEIIATVRTSQHVVDIVVGSSVGQDSAFRGAMGDEKNSKLIWDPSVSFPILVDPKQITTSRKMGTTTLTTTKTAATLAPLPAEIVLIHELGHAAQYMGELATYKTLFASGTTGIAQIEADNLTRNEWPICDDYSLARRSSYLHYKGSNETAKWAIQE
jgi:hypothetical protein